MKMIDKALMNLQNDIKARLSLNTSEATGFYACECPLCGAGRTKKTGGWKFEDDKIVYNCFRGKCDASTVYELSKPISRKFRNLMEHIGLDIPLEMRLVKSDFRKKMESLDDDLYKKHIYKDIQQPEELVSFGDAKKAYRSFWAAWFEKRCCGIDNILIANTGAYRGSCAIQMTLYGKLIGVQYITPQGKYIMVGGGNDNIIYCPTGDILNTVILVEGTIDAKCFPNTVATLKSKVTPEQAYQLRGKRVIMLPDRSGNHYLDVYKQYGWEVCIPPWDEKDLNDAVCKYGKMVVAKMIMDNVESHPLKIETKYRLWREK